MTPELFAEKLAALVTEARENGLSDDELIPILDDAVAALEEGLP